MPPVARECGSTNGRGVVRVNMVEQVRFFIVFLSSLLSSLLSSVMPGDRVAASDLLRVRSWGLKPGGFGSYTLCMRPKTRIVRTGVALASMLGVMFVLSGCALQQRRVDVPEATGSDESLDERFGLTDDAQDPSERDKELGYGRWKAKPEPTGTATKTSPSRRGSWTGQP